MYCNQAPCIGIGLPVKRFKNNSFFFILLVYKTLFHYIFLIYCIILHHIQLKPDIFIHFFYGHLYLQGHGGSVAATVSHSSFSSWQSSCFWLLFPFSSILPSDYRVYVFTPSLAELACSISGGSSGIWTRGWGGCSTSTQKTKTFFISCQTEYRFCFKSIYINFYLFNCHI